MIIPNLEKIEIQGIHPFKQVGGKINFSNPVMYFQRENGGGKTTLIDLIKIGLFRLNYFQNYREIKEKCYENYHDNKQISSFLISDWKFNDKKIKIHHNFTKKDIRSNIDSEPVRQHEYGKKIEQLFNSNLSINEIIEVFKHIVFVEEKSPEKNLFHDWNNFIEQYLPDLILNVSDFELYSSHKNNLRKKQEIISLLEKKDQFLRNREETFKDLKKKLVKIPEIKEKIEKIQEQITQTETQKTKLLKEREKIVKKLTPLQKYSKFLNQLNIREQKLNLLQEKYKNIEIERIKRENITKQFELHSNLKDEFLNKFDVRMCPVCHTTDLLSNWEKKIQEYKCPVCSLNLDMISEEVVKRIILSGDHDNNKKQINIEPENIINLNAEISALNNDVKNIRNEIENIITEHDIIKENADKVMNKLNNELLKIKNELSVNEGTINTLNNEKFRLETKQDSLEDIKETIDNDQEINRLKTQIKELKDFYEGIDSKINESLRDFEIIEKLLRTMNKEILEFIQTESKSLLNFEFRFDPVKELIFYPDGKSRYFESCSEGEKTFIDFCLKILFWKYLISKKKDSERGIIIMDNPVAIISEKYYEDFIHIIKKTKKFINYLITSNKNELYDPDFQIITSLSATQTTLMDFMTR